MLLSEDLFDCLGFDRLRYFDLVVGWIQMLQFNRVLRFLSLSIVQGVESKIGLKRSFCSRQLLLGLHISSRLSLLLHQVKFLEVSEVGNVVLVAVELAELL